MVLYERNQISTSGCKARSLCRIKVILSFKKISGWIFSYFSYSLRNCRKTSDNNFYISVYTLSMINYRRYVQKSAVAVWPNNRKLMNILNYRRPSSAVERSYLWNISPVSLSMLSSRISEAIFHEISNVTLLFLKNLSISILEIQMLIWRLTVAGFIAYCRTSLISAVLSFCIRLNSQLYYIGIGSHGNWIFIFLLTVEKLACEANGNA